MSEFAPEKVENIDEKGENANDLHSLLFPQIFISPGVVKLRRLKKNEKKNHKPSKMCRALAKAGLMHPRETRDQASRHYVKDPLNQC